MAVGMRLQGHRPLVFALGRPVSSPSTSYTCTGAFTGMRRSSSEEAVAIDIRRHALSVYASAMIVAAPSFGNKESKNSIEVYTGRTSPSMSVHLYFSLDSRSAECLDAAARGVRQVLRDGHNFKSKGQADSLNRPTYRHEYFDIDGCYARCAPKPRRQAEELDLRLDAPRNGTPHHQCDGQAVPDDGDGRTLGLQRRRVATDRARAAHVPGPHANQQPGREPARPGGVLRRRNHHAVEVVPLSRVCFVELELGPLGADPDAKEGDLPYPFMQHLREALMELDR